MFASKNTWHILADSGFTLLKSRGRDAEIQAKKDAKIQAKIEDKIQAKKEVKGISKRLKESGRVLSQLYIN